MATIVASRYAVLSVDDDDDDCDKIYSNKKKISNKKTVVKCQNPVPTKVDTTQKKKKKQENQTPQNTKKSKSAKCNDPTPKKKRELASEQWEEWKEKDDQRIEENFEEDLSKAILLSKLDYEKRKEYHGTLLQDEENRGNEKKKKKTPKVVSMNESNNTTSKSNTNNAKLKSAKTENLNEKSELFKTFDKEIKKEISKENSSNKKKVNDSISQESLTLVLYQASIDKKDREISQLKTEIERLNIQLKNVKLRNTKLCQIIASGEMKDKAEVLMEVERLQMIKDELSSEVANLHIQLERERSKVRQLTAESKTKDKAKKNQVK